MANNDKALCEWSKQEIRDRFAELVQQVLAAKYLCSKCGRAATDRELLCKPKPLTSKRANP